MTPDSNLHLSLEESQARGPEYHWQLQTGPACMLIVTDNGRPPHILNQVDTSIYVRNQLFGTAARKMPRDLENNLHCYRVNKNPFTAPQNTYTM